MPAREDEQAEDAHHEGGAVAAGDERREDQRERECEHDRIVRLVWQRDDLGEVGVDR